MSTLNALASEVHQIAFDKGFWDTERNLGEMLMLAVSELSEALDEHRAGSESVWYKHSGPCDKQSVEYWAVTGRVDTDCSCIPKPEGVAVEIADCIIRCLDTLASMGVDIDQIVAEKLVYNRSRSHKHGKAY